MPVNNIREIIFIFICNRKLKKYYPHIFLLMKNIVIPFLGLFGLLFSLNSFAEQITGVGTMNTITQVVNSMAENGIIDADVAKYRISYYHDQIFVYGTNLATVMTGSEDWARSELSNIISKRLYTLKDQ